MRVACRLALVGLFSLLSRISGAASSSLTVNIVGLPGGVTQSLPITYVQSFQRWVIEDGQVLSRVCNNKVSEIEWQDTKIRPTLDILIKSGAPSYAMTGLQVRGNEQDVCPLARQWTTFAFAVEPSFRVEAFLSNSNDMDSHTALLVEGSDPVERMKDAMELFGIAFSQTGEGSPLSEGFHIVSIPNSSMASFIRSTGSLPSTSNAV